MQNPNQIFIVVRNEVNFLDRFCSIFITFDDDFSQRLIESRI